MADARRPPTHHLPPRHHCEHFATDRSHLADHREQLTATLSLIQIREAQHQQRTGCPMSEDNVWLQARLAEAHSLELIIAASKTRPPPAVAPSAAPVPLAAPSPATPSRSASTPPAGGNRDRRHPRPPHRHTYPRRPAQTRRRDRPRRRRAAHPHQDRSADHLPLRRQDRRVSLDFLSATPNCAAASKPSASNSNQPARAPHPPGLATQPPAARPRSSPPSPPSSANPARRSPRCAPNSPPHTANSPFSGALHKPPNCPAIP